MVDELFLDAGSAILASFFRGDDLCTIHRYRRRQIPYADRCDSTNTLPECLAGSGWPMAFLDSLTEL